MQNVKKIWDNKIFKISILIGLLFLIMYILVGHETPSVGYLINKFNPCDDTILQSILAHCYSGYDWDFCLISGVISFISFLVAIITAIYSVIYSVKKKLR